MKTASLPLLLLSFAAAAGTARAGVRVEVDPGAPFTEADLVDAVEIRTPAGGGEVVVHVAKLGMDQLVVIVGDRSQIVTLPDRDRANSSRVVALVVTGMLGGDEAAERPAAAGPGVVVVPAVAPPPRSLAHRTSYGVGTWLLRDDNGYLINFVDVSVARTVSPNARWIGTLGVSQYRGYAESRSAMFPVRVGVEGHAGAAAIEIGGEVMPYREVSCGAAEWGLAAGPYGVGKVFLGITSRTKLVTELGGQFVGSTSKTTCNSALNYTKYGGWVGLGLEWTP